MLLLLSRQDASNIVSLVCGTNKIAWAQVDRGMTLLDWRQVECPNFLRGTYMASAYLNDVSTNTKVRFVEIRRFSVHKLYFCYCPFEELKESPIFDWQFHSSSR